MTRADSEILTVEDLAELFACDKETAAARLTSGDLPGVKVGRSWIIPRKALFERLNEKAHQEAAARRSELEETRQLAASPGYVAASRVTSSVSPALSARSQGRRRRQPPTLPTLEQAGITSNS